MISDLYSEKLLAAASSIPPERRLHDADATAVKTSRVCGSTVEVDLKLDGDVVVDFGMTARACALGQAAASLTAERVVGARAEELYALRDIIRAMLKDGGPPPSDDRWRDLAALQAIKDFPQRHASTLLVFEAIAECLDQIAARPSA